MGTILAALSLLLLLPLIFRQYLTFAHTRTFFLLSGRNISHPLQKKIGTVAQSAQQLPDTIPAPVPASDTLPSAAASISGLSLLRLLRLKPSLCFALKNLHNLKRGGKERDSHFRKKNGSSDSREVQQFGRATSLLYSSIPFTFFCDKFNPSAVMMHSE